MADFEAPSFSLGLDLDFDSQPQNTRTKDHSKSCKQAQDSSSNVNFHALQDNVNNNDDDDGDKNECFEAQVADSDPDSDPGRPMILKRLRRGPKREGAVERGWGGGEDEIEEFSSQEGLCTDEHPSTQHHSMCSSSKFPLHGHGFLTTQSASHPSTIKRKLVSHAPASASWETSSDKLTFTKFNSPLRRFQLLDSDSDDEDASGHSDKSDPLSKEKVSIPGKNVTPNEGKRTKSSVNLLQNEDLWKDFCPMKSFNIPTPALDEVCEEYFRSVDDQVVAQKLESDLGVSNSNGCYQKKNSSQNIEQHWDLADPLPPAHRYFFHDDPRIQKLVRSRLPNFSPLGVVDSGGNKQHGAPVIDYMGQFNHGEAARQQPTRNTNARSETKGGRNVKRSNAKEISRASGSWVDPKQCANIPTTNARSATRGGRNVKRSNAKEISQASGSWVDPKQCATIPKDAGKRRVHADDRSAGHWYTASDGQRVYVNKSGQELTGQIAYRQYRKESGAGFRKSKKKSRAKKK